MSNEAPTIRLKSGSYELNFTEQEDKDAFLAEEGYRNGEEFKVFNTFAVSRNKLPMVVAEALESWTTAG